MRIIQFKFNLFEMFVKELAPPTGLEVKLQCNVESRIFITDLSWLPCSV